MDALLTGTVTFVFTDIEGSTRLVQALGDLYADVLEDHRRLLREAFDSFGGRQVDTQGDACFYAFARAREALQAAVTAQRALLTHTWPPEGPVRVRMGIHTGEPLAAGTRYVGIAVHRAARICAAAHGGQVLVSTATEELLSEELPESITLLDLGDYRLKDLAHPQRLFQVVAPGLPDSFPALHTLDTLPNNLPRQLTSFVGRQREIEEIRGRLEQTLLLTLVGVGGSGKTRLALQVAADIIDRYADGVWWVPLASLTEPGLIPQAVALALGVVEQRGRQTVDAVFEHLAGKSLMLLLDNAEHLLAACAAFVDTALRRCPGLRVLVTSREPLRVEGEQVHEVPPLAVPVPGTLLPVATLSQSEAVRLFVERAVSMRAGFVLTEQNAAAILQVCRRTEGIPLAIELAAARVRALSVDQIAARLDDQFRRRVDGPAIAGRHETLWATMDWSYGLLGAPEQGLFQRLAIFVGSFSLEAAETVCADARLPAQEIVEILVRLVEKSLVVAEDQGREVRYRLLEPVRLYALEKLRETGEVADVRSRHFSFFLQLAERAHTGLAGIERVLWRARIEVDHDNLRGALRGAVDAGTFEDAAHLGAAMARFWVSRGFLNEGWTWLQDLRRHEETLSPRIRARLLHGLGLLAFEIGAHEQVASAETALAIFEDLGDREEVENCTRLLGLVELERGRYERAAVLLDRAAELARERGDVLAEAEALRQRGYLAGKQGDYALAVRLLERSLAVVGPIGLRRSIGLGLGHLAQVHHYEGRSEQAITMLREALSHLQAVEHGTGTAYFLNVLGLVLLQRGDIPGAREAYTNCLVFARETGYQWAIAQSLIGFAGLHAAEGAPESAARLLAAANALLMRIDYTIPAAEQDYVKRLAAILRRVMGDERFEFSWRNGQIMTVDDAVDLATSEAPMEPSRQPADRPRPAAPRSSGILSPRERDVARLVAAGRTNREIAHALGVAERTATAHIQNILNKLGFNSRAQIAAWATAHGLTPLDSD
jgi:predicted ATPase/class 3 adenylate cyclase/DNA-binding CsgD family transcriptional regulator